jgi:hypothetical protein
MEMRRILQASFLTSAIVTGALACTTTPVFAQMDRMGDEDAAISFDSFHDQLESSGYWLYSDRWGIVWQPADVPYDFRPYYTAGHWVYTDDYGWYWESKYPWGDIPFHYGRWVNDPDDGWLWIPGYIWSPGWVAWRSNGAYIGWTPLPPDDAFLEGHVSFRFAGFDVGALYSRWYGPTFNERRLAANWVFLPAGFIVAPDYQRVVIRDPVRIVNIIHQTRNVTKYTVVNNIVVNKSVDVRVVERAAGRPIPVVRAATVIRRPNLVASVVVGQRVQLRMREMIPRGRGIANSAPPPPPHVVAKLSVNVTPRNGHAPVHLFTKATVAAPEAQSRFRGPPVRGSATGGEVGGGTTVSPSGEPMRAKLPNGMPGPGAAGTHTEQPNGMTPSKGERMRREQPGAQTGPNDNEQPNGTTGPNGERPRREQPGAQTGPNGNEQPNGMAGPNSARMRREQPGAQTGPNGNEQPNGMTGPNTERMRPQTPNNTTAPSGERARGQQPAAGAAPDANGNPDNGNPPQHKKKEQQNPPQNRPQ